MIKEETLIRRSLIEGVDPSHARYWGELADYDQRAVEMGSLAACICLSPQLLWEPLSQTERSHLANWLMQINKRLIGNHNWIFFRVLVNVALRAMNYGYDSARLAEDFDLIDALYIGRGRYRDGSVGHIDYYLPMAFHFYGMLLCRFDRFETGVMKSLAERARIFAPHFALWFAPDGSALPIGRSLTYRFAQGAFWGALAFADIEVLPWGVVKRLHLQHLRWWLARPIFTNDGLLSVGYGYPNQLVGEAYSGLGSPYWAAKAFLPLALPHNHPFWLADEQEINLPAITNFGDDNHQLVFCRDAAHGHVFAISANPPKQAHVRHAAQKYGKFVYSTSFPFSVPIGGSAPSCGAADSMLLVSPDKQDWRARDNFESGFHAPAAIWSRWSPWPQIFIESWIISALPGHVCIHCIRTEVPFYTCEGGYPIEITGIVKLALRENNRTLLDNGLTFSGIWDLFNSRSAEIVLPEPNTNLLHPRTAVPILNHELTPGTTLLASAVLGLPCSEQHYIASQWRDQFKIIEDGSLNIWFGSNLLFMSPITRVR